MGLSNDLIPINEIFTSFQGEGRNIGIPYHFIRVAGCPLRCAFCDTERSWSAEQDQIRSVTDVIDQAIQICQERGIGWVSITGGEPLLYPNQLLKIIKDLKFYNIKTHIETSGRFYDEQVHQACDLYSPDAKTPCTGETTGNFFGGINMMRECDQVKCLIQTEVDLEYAHKVNERLDGDCVQILQPFNTQILTNSTKNMSDVMRNERPTEQPNPSEIRKHMCLHLQWLFETFKKRCASGEKWKNVMITPQIHVLAHGNQAGY